MVKYQKIANELRNQIQEGVYKAGEQLALEREMCEQYGVSRITIKKAVDQLVKDGLVVKRRGSGTFVKSLAGEDVHDISMANQFSGFSKVFEGHEIATRSCALTTRRCPCARRAGCSPCTARGCASAGLRSTRGSLRSTVRLTRSITRKRRCQAEASGRACSADEAAAARSACAAHARARARRGARAGVRRAARAVAAMRAARFSARCSTVRFACLRSGACSCLA